MCVYVCACVHNLDYGLRYSLPQAILIHCDPGNDGRTRSKEAHKRSQPTQQEGGRGRRMSGETFRERECGA